MNVLEVLEPVKQNRTLVLDTTIHNAVPITYSLSLTPSPVY